MEKKFKTNELVWAKIRGYPYWPAVIGNIYFDSNNEKKIKVFFIGDPTHAELPESKLEKYDIKYNEFSKSRQKSLSNSINIANEISRGIDGVLKEINKKTSNFSMLFQNASKKNLNKILSKENNNIVNSNDSNKSFDNIKNEARKNKDIFSRDETNISEIMLNKSIPSLAVINKNINSDSTNTKNADMQNNLGAFTNPILLETFSEEFTKSSNIITNSLEMRASAVNTRNKINSNSNNLNVLKINENKEKDKNITKNNKDSDSDNKNFKLLSKLFNQNKTLDKKRLIKSKRLKQISDKTKTEDNCGEKKSSSNNTSPTKSRKKLGMKRNKFNFDKNYEYYYMPKRSTRSRRKNKLYFSESNSNNESLEISYNSEISDSSEEDANENLQELKNGLNSQLNELVFYKIEMPSSSSNKKIISCIEKILEIFNKIYNYKADEKNEESKIPLDENLKITSSELSDIEKKENSNSEKKNKKEKKIHLKNFNTFEESLPILMCLNNHKTPEIAEKVYGLINLIKQRTLNEIFEFRDFEEIENSEENKKEKQAKNKDMNVKQNSIKEKENLLNFSESNIGNFQKGLIKEIFDSKNKKILDAKFQLKSRNSSVRKNTFNGREGEKSFSNKRQNSENFNGRIPINNKGKGNYSNNSSLINKYNSILMSKKIKEEKKNKLNRDPNSTEIIGIEDTQFEAYIDSSLFSVKENTSNLTNNSLCKYKMRNSRRENMEKKRKEIPMLKKRANNNKGITENFREEESNSLSELSLSNCINSTKNYSGNVLIRKKIRLFPLTNNEVFRLFQDASKDLVTDMSENDFCLALEDKENFKNILESDINKIILPVKYGYLRKRVCYKLYKVLTKLLKHYDFENDLVKSISILFEYTARKEDPLMSNKYREIVSSIFHNIKVINLFNFKSTQLLKIDSTREN